MNKKRLLSTILAIFFVASLLASCAQPSPTPQQTEAAPAAPTEAQPVQSTEAPTVQQTESVAPAQTEAPTAQPLAEEVTIRFMTSETDPPSVAAYEAIIKAFEAENPGVKISLELVNADDLNVKLPASLAIGAPPNISQLDAHVIPDYAKAGHIVPLDDIIDKIGRDDFYQGSLFQVDGKTYNMPYAGSGTVWWVRKDLFEQYNVKLPTTPEELLDAAKKLTLDTNNDGQTDIYGIALPAGTNQWTAHMMNSFVWQNGQSIFDKDLNPNFNTPRTVEAVKLYADLAKYAPEGIGSYSYFETIDAFTAGKVAIAPYMGRLLSSVKANNPDLLDKTMAIPFVAGTYNKANYGNWDSYVVYQAAGNVDIAKKFVAFLTTGDQAFEFLRTVPGHLIPPLLSMRNSPKLWDEPLMQSHKQDVETVFKDAETALNIGNEAGAIDADGKMTNTRVLNPYANALLSQNVFAQVIQKVVLEGQTPEDAVAWGQQEIERIISEQQ